MPGRTPSQRLSTMSASELPDPATRLGEIITMAGNALAALPRTPAKVRAEVAANLEELLHLAAPLAGRLATKRARESAETRERVDDLMLKLAVVLADL
jgi:hypothetical protein